MTHHARSLFDFVADASVTRELDRIVKLRWQLRVEMKLAGYQAADLLDATDDAIHRELTERGEEGCAAFLALWVCMLRKENRTRPCT